MSATPLRIALAGTHGSGKSSLATPLAAYLKVAPITVSRPTQAARKLGFNKASDVPSEQVRLFQWMGLMEQIHQERLHVERPTIVEVDGIGLEHTKPGFVSDRSTLDFLAYAQMRMGAEKVPQAYWDLAVTHAHQGYDAILYLPPNPNGVENDNRRFTTGTQEIADRIESLLRVNVGLSERTIDVPWLPLDERVAWVVKAFAERNII